MERRVEVSGWVEFQWPYLIAFLGGEARLTELARETGAFERARKIGSPSDLLRLLLFRVGGGRSFMDTATIAAEAGVADLSDAALVKRFAKAADWLGRLVCEAIGWNEQQRLPGLCVDVVDATTVGRRGAKGTDHRLHLRIDLASNRVVEAELTDAKGGETLDRFAIRAGGVVIADAGYAHRGPLGSIAERGGHFLVRFGWSNFPLENEAGEPLDLLATLESLPEAEPAEFAVFFRTPGGSRAAPRLVGIRKRRAGRSFGTAAASSAAEQGAKVARPAHPAIRRVHVPSEQSAEGEFHRERACSLPVSMADRDQVQGPQVAVGPRPRTGTNGPGPAGVGVREVTARAPG